MNARGPLLRRICLLGGLGLMVFLACSITNNVGESLTEMPTQELLELIPPEDLTEMAAGGSQASPAPPTVPPVTAGPEGACPQEPAAYALVASHYFWVDTGMGNWVWESDGVLQILLDASGQVTNTAAQTVGGKQSGEFVAGDNRCAFQAPAEVFTTVAGFCRDGVLNLQVSEDWVSGTYEWVCDEDAFQFDLPQPMIPASHSLQIPLVPGAQVEEAFGGGGGTKAWTLVME